MRTAFAAALLICAATVAPAGAASVSVTDPRGDASGVIDTTKVTVKVTKTSVIAVFTVPHLAKAKASIFDIGGSYVGGKPKMLMTTWIGPQNKVTVGTNWNKSGGECPGVTASWNLSKHTVRMKSPLQCTDGSWFGRRFYARAFDGPHTEYVKKLVLPKEVT